MTKYLQIQARLPRAAGLEFSARLLAAQPAWDIELDDGGLSVVRPVGDDGAEKVLAGLEEFCLNLAKTRGPWTGLRTRLGPELADNTEPLPDLEKARGVLDSHPAEPFERPGGARPLLGAEPDGAGLDQADGESPAGLVLEINEAAEPPLRPTPAAAGPWRLRPLAEGESPPPPRPDQLLLPFGRRASKRFWAGEALLLTLLAEHLTPPPGAPETRGRPALALESVLPLTPLAAVLAGASEAVLAAEEESDVAAALEAAAVNARASAVTTVGTPFQILARRREDWLGRFGLIAVHLSPYLASRRLKTLRRWLHPEGSLILGGFAPGPQTAHLLRAAARAGLHLTGSVIEGDWAAMKLEIAPEREELPPLTGSVVPELVDLPAEETPEPEPDSATEAEADDEDSLMMTDEEEFEDEA